ncbi:MAG: hypothetical protein FJ034_04750, partial [Chloroflexi bacterium]|nr:hypothetical protein [Chloroflexota bacterium]
MAKHAFGVTGRSPRPGPLAAGFEVAAGMVRVVTVRREGSRLKVVAGTAAPLAPGAMRGGLVVDRAGVSAAAA